VVEFVLRFEAQQKRRIVVLFQHHGGDHRRFEAVSLASSERGAKRAQRRPFALAVIAERRQKFAAPVRACDAPRSSSIHAR